MCGQKYAPVPARALKEEVWKEQIVPKLDSLKPGEKVGFALPAGIKLEETINRCIKYLKSKYPKYDLNIKQQPIYINDVLKEHYIEVELLSGAITGKAGVPSPAAKPVPAPKREAKAVPKAVSQPVECYSFDDVSSKTSVLLKKGGEIKAYLTAGDLNKYRIKYEREISDGTIVVRGTVPEGRLTGEITIVIKRR